MASKLFLCFDYLWLNTSYSLISLHSLYCGYYERSRNGLSSFFETFNRINSVARHRRARYQSQSWFEKRSKITYIYTYSGQITCTRKTYWYWSKNPQILLYCLFCNCSTDGDCDCSSNLYLMCPSRCTCQKLAYYNS